MSKIAILVKRLLDFTGNPLLEVCFNSLVTALALESTWAKDFMQAMELNNVYHG